MPVRSPNRRDVLALIGAAALARPAHAAPSYDLLIRGGRVIDPAQRLNAVRDVAISAGRIAAVAAHIAPGAAQVIDAAGTLVVPGLIDIHTHATVDPESPALMLATGVTGWVETGWQGADTLDPGIAAVRASPQPGALLINIGRKGVIAGAGETTDLALADVAAARAAIAAHRDVVIGVKARLSRMITGDHDLEVLRRAKAAAQPFGMPVMIHIGDTASPLGELLDLLERGDIVTHVYAPRPNAIVDAQGRPIAQAIAARKRGVLFDWGHGTRGHIVWDVVAAAVAAGFLPDTLSTDWTLGGAKADVTLPTVMSAMLSYGVPLERVVAMATINAARSFPLFAGRGTLRPGAPADVALLELRDGSFDLLDNAGTKRAVARKLVPVATILGGRLVVSPA